MSSTLRLSVAPNCDKYSSKAISMQTPNPRSVLTFGLFSRFSASIAASLQRAVAAMRAARSRHCFACSAKPDFSYACANSSKSC